MLPNLPKYSYHHLSNITKLKKKPLYWQPLFWFGIPHCFKILSSVAISMVFWEKAVKIQEKNSKKSIHGSKQAVTRIKFLFLSYFLIAKFG